VLGFGSCKGRARVGTCIELWLGLGIWLGLG
jgi:hypothetical protein